MKKTLLSILCVLSMATSAHGHEEERFSPAFVHPIELHHAHNETELRVNILFRRDVRYESVDEETGEEQIVYKDVFENVFEMAWASPDGRLGIEAEVPFSSEGRDWRGEAIYGLGDIEIEPIRYSWVADREAVFTTSLGFILPTGDETDGLGEGKAFLEPHFLAEKVFGSLYLAANLIPSFELDGEHEKALGWGVMTAYSLRLEEPVWAVSLELSGGSGVVSLTPGIHGQISELEFRLGLRIPVSSDREETPAYFFSIGV